MISRCHRFPRSSIRRFLGLGAAAVLVLAACGDDSTDSADAPVVGCDGGTPVEGRPLRIAATVAPITSIVANVVGDAPTVVTGLVPEGTNSHTFEPPPSLAATLADSDVVFINGLVLEEPTKDLALANLASGAALCELGTEILPREDWIFDFSFPEDGGKPNPHLWTNPPMAKEYAEITRDVLSRLDPANADLYATNTAAFSAQIDALDEAVSVATATIPEDQRLLVTYHDAYAYFAERYGWTVLGAIQPSSFDEPTAREVAELIEQIRETQVPAIFGSEVFPSPVLAQIGDETGVRYIDVLRDDDLPGAPGDQDHSWLALMRFNFVTMVEALGGDASALAALDVTPVVTDNASYPQ